MSKKPKSQAVERAFEWKWNNRMYSTSPQEAQGKFKTSEKYQKALRLMQSLEKLRKENFGCDFEVRVGQKKFPVHRSVLAASSEYFKAILKKGTKEAHQGYIEIKGLKISAVKASLDYLYTGQVDLEFDSIEPILKAADMLQIDDLKELSINFMLKSISVDNCLLVRQYSVTYNIEEALKFSENFLAKNFPAFAKTEIIKSLDIMQFQVCIKIFKDSSSLPSATSVLWEAVANWVEFDRDERGDQLLPLLKSIDPLDVSTVFSEILVHPLTNSRRDYMDFLFTEVVLKSVGIVLKYITIDNCFILRQWAKWYNSPDLKAEIWEFMIQNIDEISKSEQVVGLYLEDIKALMVTKNGDVSRETAKYGIIIRWIRGKETERMQYFEQLFGLLNVSHMPADFIYNIRNEPLVKACPACNESIVQALYNHAKK